MEHPELIKPPTQRSGDRPSSIHEAHVCEKSVQIMNRCICTLLLITYARNSFERLIGRYFVCESQNTFFREGWYPHACGNCRRIHLSALLKSFHLLSISLAVPELISCNSSQSSGSLIWVHSQYLSHVLPSISRPALTFRDRNGHQSKSRSPGISKRYSDKH